MCMFTPCCRCGEWLIRRRRISRNSSPNTFDVPNAHVYDSTNPQARDFYWNNQVSPLFSQGWDAFWLDSAEPEEYWPHWGDAILRNKQIAIGNGAEYTNIPAHSYSWNPAALASDDG